MKAVKQMSPLTLAYAGDAVIELYVRQHLLYQGLSKPKDLHRAATDYVSAHAQAYVLQCLQAKHVLSDAELAVIRRGKNAKSISVPKHTPVKIYRLSTALEALFGYLHMLGEQERVRELMTFITTEIDQRKEGESHGT